MTNHYENHWIQIYNLEYTYGYCRVHVERSGYRMRTYIPPTRQIRCFEKITIVHTINSYRTKTRQ